MNNPEKHKLYIICEGGLNDRLGCIVSGLYLKDYYNFEPIIIWTISNRCRCKFHDLFETLQMQVIYTNDILSTNHQCIVTPELLELLGEEKLHQHFIYDHRFPRWSVLRQKYILPHDSNCIIFINRPLPKLSTNLVGYYLSYLVPIHTIQNEVLQFCDAYGINSDVIGAHLRMTDLGNQEDFMYILKKIYRQVQKNPGTKIFLCSDDGLYKKALSALFPDVIISRQKEAYVQKMDETKGWFESPNKDIRYNVDRSVDACIEGLIDFLILSRTTVKIGREKSGFFKNARSLSRFMWKKNSIKKDQQLSKKVAS